MPYTDFYKSAQCLDYRRLGKQRVEAYQILGILKYGRSNSLNRWKNHPCVIMWEGYEKALEEYLNAMIIEWVHRGYKNTMSLYQVCLVKYPTWLGDKNFHDAYKSNLLRKDPVFYGKYNWNVPSNLPYTWGK